MLHCHRSLGGVHSEQYTQLSRSLWFVFNLIHERQQNQVCLSLATTVAFCGERRRLFCTKVWCPKDSNISFILTNFLPCLECVKSNNMFSCLSQTRIVPLYFFRFLYCCKYMSTDFLVIYKSWLLFPDFLFSRFETYID